MPLSITAINICDSGCDFIVCPTDGEFSGSGGTDRAIHKKAGALLDEYCGGLPELKVSETVLTPSFLFGCRGIIHTRGPVWMNGERGEEKALEDCYGNALETARKNGGGSIAFPLISAGSFGFPKTAVLDIAVRSISAFLNGSEDDISVVLCIPDRSVYEVRGEKELDGYLLHGELRAGNRIAAAEAQASLFSLGNAPKAGRRKAKPFARAEKAADAGMEKVCCDETVPAGDLDGWLLAQDTRFSEKLLSLIDSRGMSDVECYKKANIDRRTFSKIRSNPDYRPAKQTAIAFAVALRLDIKKTEELLRCAGYALSDSFIGDRIVKYYILRGNFDINEINIALFDHDQPLLGTGM